MVSKAKVLIQEHSANVFFYFHLWIITSEMTLLWEPWIIVITMVILWIKLYRLLKKLLALLWWNLIGRESGRGFGEVKRLTETDLLCLFYFICWSGLVTFTSSAACMIKTGHSTLGSQWEDLGIASIEKRESIVKKWHSLCIFVLVLSSYLTEIPHPACSAGPD